MTPADLSGLCGSRTLCIGTAAGGKPMQYPSSLIHAIHYALNFLDRKDEKTSLPNHRHR